MRSRATHVVAFVIGWFLLGRALDWLTGQWFMDRNPYQAASDHERGGADMLRNLILVGFTIGWIWLCVKWFWPDAVKADEHRARVKAAPKPRSTDWDLVIGCRWLCGPACELIVGSTGSGA